MSCFKTHALKIKCPCTWWSNKSLGLGIYLNADDGLKNFKESIIFASHDHEFIQTLANHIIVLSKNGVIDRIDETYDEFLENAEVQAKVKELWKD